MAERQELQVVLRTIAQGQGAQQTATGLRQVRAEASATNNVTQLSIASLARWAGGLAIATSAASALTEVLSSSINVQRENERLIRATAAAYGQQAQEFERFAGGAVATDGVYVASHFAGGTLSQDAKRQLRADDPADTKPDSCKRRSGQDQRNRCR